MSLPRKVQRLFLLKVSQLCIFPAPYQCEPVTLVTAQSALSGQLNSVYSFHEHCPALLGRLTQQSHLVIQSREYSVDFLNNERHMPVVYRKTRGDIYC